MNLTRQKFALTVEQDYLDSRSSLLVQKLSEQENGHLLSQVAKRLILARVGKKKIRNLRKWKMWHRGSPDNGKKKKI